MLRFLSSSVAIEEPVDDEVAQLYDEMDQKLSRSRDSLEAACDKADEIQKRRTDPPQLRIVDPPTESGTAE